MHTIYHVCTHTRTQTIHGNFQIISKAYAFKVWVRLVIYSFRKKIWDKVLAATVSGIDRRVGKSNDFQIVIQKMETQNINLL